MVVISPLFIIHHCLSLINCLSVPIGGYIPLSLPIIYHPSLSVIHHCISFSIDCHILLSFPTAHHPPLYVNDNCLSLLIGVISHYHFPLSILFQCLSFTVIYHFPLVDIPQDIVCHLTLFAIHHCLSFLIGCHTTLSCSIVYHTPLSVIHHCMPEQ